MYFLSKKGISAGANKVSMNHHLLINLDKVHVFSPVSQECSRFECQRCARMWLRRYKRSINHVEMRKRWSFLV